MNLESSVNDLTLQTTNLLGVCVALRDDVSILISDAVVNSVNAAQIPLVTMATNLIDTQSLLVTYIARG